MTQKTGVCRRWKQDYDLLLNVREDRKAVITAKFGMKIRIF